MKIFCFVLFFCSFLSASPEAIYLVVPQDPSHSMSVHWIEKKQKCCFSSVLYRKEGDLEWRKNSYHSLEVLGRSVEASLYFVKKVLLTDLEAGAFYDFCLEGEDKIYHFRTLPSKIDTPLKIAIGGDFTEDFSLYARMNRVAAQKNPDFVVLGGDIAYACNKGVSIGHHGSVGKWVDFFVEWQKSMIAEGGRMIPVAPLVGNHDVTSVDRAEHGKNAFYLKFFPSEQGLTYNTIEIAGTVSLFLLDTGHLFSVEGEQVRWLEEEFKKKDHISWKIPIYHVAGYPSTYSYGSANAKNIRKWWVPLFERYGIKLVFEHHNHAYKRTHALLNDQIDPSGIVYIGDGGWGAPPRGKVENRSYLAKGQGVSCFSFLQVTPSSLRVEAFDVDGTLIDAWEAKGR